MAASGLSSGLRCRSVYASVPASAPGLLQAAQLCPGGVQGTRPQRNGPSLDWVKPDTRKGLRRTCFCGFLEAVQQRGLQGAAAAG